MGPNDELRVGVIGAGGRGHLAWSAHQPGEGSRLVAGCDVRDAALAEFKAKFGADVFVTKDYREILDRADVDVVFVTTPDFLHEEHAVAALQAGKPVYLEKPMAITVEGCDHILRAAFEAKVPLYLGHNMRHYAATRKMKSLICEGRIGEPKAGWCRHFVCYGCDAYFKDWHAERRYSTSLFLQKGCHDIDILHWLMDAYTERTVAMGGLTLYDQISDRHPADEPGDASWSLDHWPPLSNTGLNPVIDVEDLGMMLMQLEGGRFASYQQCHYAPDGWRNYTIIGTAGRIENFGLAPGGSVVRLWNARVGYNPYGDEQFFTPRSTGSHGGSDPRIVAEFLRYVREGGKIATSPIAARQSVAAGCMAAASLRQGNIPMDIPRLPAELVAYFDADLESDYGAG